MTCYRLSRTVVAVAVDIRIDIAVDVEEGPPYQRLPLRLRRLSLWAMVIDADILLQIQIPLPPTYLHDANFTSLHFKVLFFFYLTTGMLCYDRECFNSQFPQRVKRKILSAIDGTTFESNGITALHGLG